MKKFLLYVFLFCFAALFAGDEVYTLEYSGNRNTLFCNGKVVTFADCVEKQLARYPEYTAIDITRFAYDGAFGGGCHKFDKVIEEKNIRQDFAAAKAEKRPLFEIVSPDYCRINFSAWKFHKLPVEWLFSICCASAEIFADSSAIYSDYLRIVAPMIAARLKMIVMAILNIILPPASRVMTIPELKVGGAASITSNPASNAPSRMIQCRASQPEKLSKHKLNSAPVINARINFRSIFNSLNFICIPLTRKIVMIMTGVVMCFLQNNPASGKVSAQITASRIPTGRKYFFNINACS